MIKQWTWNTITYPFDVSEAGCMGRLLAALEGLRENLSRFRREQDADDMLSCHCGILQEFFDDIFGDGSGEKLCGKALSAEVYSRAYIDFMDFVNGQIDELNRLRQEAEEKYLARAAALGLDVGQAG
ncbi:MAG: hypothetical protein IJB15_05305 [Clostridia bacterium]|nr:hypothetical protein [Clostridia bacterium]